MPQNVQSPNPSSPIVHGVNTSPKLQCSHWSSDLDIIAIRHKCCMQYYACISCHNELAGHEPEVWQKSEHHELAVLCGNCGRGMTIAEYLGSHNRCPGCAAGFNPGCSKHYDLYFET
ncbi:zinc finger CHY domain-containing protein [Fusarium tricinctum]|uniref:Zinc finger CHY domain-containing protein n=1 Tax=Fusarium tricinctum TaxID=61284 RepID=A0A8K0RLB5_9HYPO|nr:zinc finger CHY domain-containing protein [Fusarium tricinctum]